MRGENGDKGKRAGMTKERHSDQGNLKPMRSSLPEPFADLESLAADWSLATQREREEKRLASTADDLKAVYDALLPRLDAMLEYLNASRLDALPADAQRLFFLTLSFAEIAPFVECYRGEPRVPDSFDESRFHALHADRSPFA